MGKQRAKKHHKAVLLTIAKMLRTGACHFNDRDDAAIAELKAHFKLYVTHVPLVLDYLRLLNKKYKQVQIDKEKREKMILSFMDVSDEIIKKSGVS